MASYNRTTIMGNVTRDAECKYTAGGTAICNIDIAVNHSWFDKQANERKEEVTYVPVTLWGRTAEVAAEYLRKGKPVLIEGRLKTDSWTDKESGQKRSKMIVVGESMQLLGGGAARAPSGDSENQSPPNDNYGAESQDPEVPF